MKYQVNYYKGRKNYSEILDTEEEAVAKKDELVQAGYDVYAKIEQV